MLIVLCDFILWCVGMCCGMAGVVIAMKTVWRCCQLLNREVFFGGQVVHLGELVGFTAFFAIPLVVVGLVAKVMWCRK